MVRLAAEFEFMPDPQFNHTCPTCGTFESVIEHSTGHWLWRTCGYCGECEGVRIEDEHGMATSG